MVTLTSQQRLLLFLLPLIVAALLLWIPVRDALEVGLPDAEIYAADVPEGHHWVAFTVAEDDVHAHQWGDALSRPSNSRHLKARSTQPTALSFSTWKT